MSEIVQDKVTGLHFQPGSAVDLAAKVGWAWSHPEEMRRMCQNARAEHVAKYRPLANYEMLINIYRGAMARRARQSTIGRAPRPSRLASVLHQRRRRWPRSASEIAAR
jgi:hypothetical protein